MPTRRAPPLDAVTGVSSLFSLGHGTLMQPADGIQGRCHRAFLPSTDERGVLAGQNDPSVDGAQLIVVLGARVARPHAGASHREGNAMPRHGHSIVELLAILAVNLLAVI